MIKSLMQCQEVQEKRVKSGKKGYAKAVRRYVSKSTPKANYRDTMNSFPVIWNPEHQEEKLEVVLEK